MRREEQCAGNRDIHFLQWDKRDASIPGNSNTRIGCAKVDAAGDSFHNY
jgi:hypothetical protein